MKFYITVFCLMLFLVLSFSTSFAQLNWTKDPNIPVLTGGAPFAWNENILKPSILFNPDSGRYEVWFGAFTRWTPYYWRPYHIGYAFSDNGINNWDMHNTPVLDTTTGKWDDLTVEAQTVILENGIYKMWYSGWNLVGDSAGIGYATSTDGIDWQKHPSYIFGPGTAAWEAGFPYGCSVMPVTGGYKMWYTATDLNESEWNIGYAFSGDGITWQRDTVNNPVLEVGSAGSWDDYAVTIPFVHRIDSTYYMFFKSFDSNDNLLNQC